VQAGGFGFQVAFWVAFINGAFDVIPAGGPLHQTQIIFTKKNSALEHHLITRYLPFLHLIHQYC
jgi:hypothetical protein